MTTTRAVTLLRRPVGGTPHADDFLIQDCPLPSPAEDQLLVRNIVMSVDPAMRGRLEPTEKHYTTNFQVGEPLDGSCIGVVERSESANFQPGALVRHRLGWREFAVVDSATVTLIDERLAPAGAWLGILGQTGFTAWVGVRRIAPVTPGATVFVSAAAGAVGSAVGEFARLLGAGTVIGSAGGVAKVALLTDRMGFGAAFDHRAGSALDHLARLAPDGLDVYFDNVGGRQLVAALHSMRQDGHIALCGMISQYDLSAPREDINELIQAVLRRVTIRGFIVRDHEDLRPDFEQRVASWLHSGQLVPRQTLVDGLENAVDAFLGMLHGENIGKMLVRLDTSWAV